MREQKPLTDEKFQEIKEKHITKPRGLHGVAYAHGTDQHKDKYIAFTDGCDYLVTEEQRTEAKKLIEQKRRKLVAEYQRKKVLVFISMGMSFKPKDNSHIGNHRIRSYFLNSEGIRCFIEVGAQCKDNSLMRCDHSIFNYASDYKTQEDREAMQKDNYHNLARTINKPYTYNALLELVNEGFGCNYKLIVVDEWTLRPDEMISISPKAPGGPSE